MMNKIAALSLPGTQTQINGPEGLKGEFVNLSSIISKLLEVAFFIGVFMCFIWLVWGAFQFLVARSNKEELARARGRMIWAIVGMIIILLAYTVSRYIGEIFTPKGGVPF